MVTSCRAVSILALVLVTPGSAVGVTSLYRLTAIAVR